MLLALCFAVALVANKAFAAPYIVTTYVQESVYTYPGYTRSYTTIAPSLYTYTEDVIPATPVSAITTITQTDNYDSDVTEVAVVVASGSTPSYSSHDYSALTTQYVVPITYLPNATCTGQSWTFSTNVAITLPAVVSPTPVSLSTSATTYTYGDYDPTPTTAIIAVLNPTDVSADDLASASSYGKPYGLNRECYTPTSYCTTPTDAAATCTTTFVADRSSSSSINDPYSYSSDDYDDYEDSWIRTTIIIAVTVPVGWILIWLLIGLWESWLSFKGLMLGQHRKRGLPYAWCCISILFLCFTGPTYKAKSVEEQARLAELWKEMGAGTKFKLWMKWGFRWKYPVDVLGEEPEVAKRALRQGCL
ncbi:hypothetical protein LSUE1_G009033 [Lachnellula suecica]|uniref:Uncharacterized protein n=1 Tax=Lachnellula suecica TaxID=602035 RepID=A0A8T9C977_9HELO|nr:hypothetical protein LSUE1_G009033 [Lachnellula suecica]